MTVLDDLQAPAPVTVPRGPDTVMFTPDEWIVAFEPRTSLWWGRFLPEGFGHCWAFGCAAGIWVSVEPWTTGTRVSVVSDEVVLHWFTLAKIKKLRLLAAKPEGYVAVRPRFMVTCAGCVASLLGLRRFPLTPQGLFWMLRRRGAQEVGRNIDG